MVAARATGDVQCASVTPNGGTKNMSWKYRQDEVDMKGPKVLDFSYETLITTRTLTAADNGKTFFLDLAGGFTVTLPVSATIGSFFCRFIVKTSPTTAYVITDSLTTSGDTIVGWPINIGGADSVADGNAAGDQLAFVANTALAGDMAEFWGWEGKWYVQATAKAINAIAITG